MKIKIPKKQKVWSLEDCEKALKLFKQAYAATPAHLRDTTATLGKTFGAWRRAGLCEGEYKGWYVLRMVRRAETRLQKKGKKK